MNPCWYCGKPGVWQGRIDRDQGLRDGDEMTTLCLDHRLSIIGPHQHKWVDATNSRLSNTAVCLGCGAICALSEVEQFFDPRIVTITAAARKFNPHHDPPDEICEKCFDGCDDCQNGVIPWEWKVAWDDLEMSQ